ncbi:MAG: glycosyltransferase involved in cell wall biosynthesis [Patiriisocius sp.]|jgi:glycosyltransferase involved in cell wall biosynthesis
MRVLWFSNTPASGLEFLQKGTALKGTGGWMHALNSALKDKIDLSVAFHYPYKIECFDHKNTRYYPIYSGNIYLSLLKNRFFATTFNNKHLERYLAIIKEVNPDIIHIHGTENPFISILNHVNTPIVVSIQGNLTVYNHKFFTGFHGRFLRQMKPESLKEILLGPKNFKKDKISFSKKSLFEQKNMSNIKYVIGRTKWDYRITRVLSPKSLYFQGEEMLRKTFYESVWSNPFREGKLIIFTTNGDNYFKGMETVFHAVFLLKSMGIAIDWRIAGISESSLISNISKKFLGDHFPTGGYTLLGSLSEEEIVAELLNAHCYVMPSHIENSPNNLCEAMMLGMPCVATYAGGTGSMLKDGEEGILIQDGDPWVMAGAILELKNDTDKALKYAQNARKRALLRHDKDKLVNQLLKIYKTIIDKETHETVL